jgi:hypothetical protein
MLILFRLLTIIQGVFEFGMFKIPGTGGYSKFKEPPNTCLVYVTG